MRARFALGSYSVLSGVLYLLVFFSEDARQIDDFLNNAVAAQLFWLIGSTLLICSLAGFGLQRWMVFLLAVGTPMLGVVLLSVATLDQPQIFIPVLALDATALIALGMLLAHRQQRWQIPAQGVLLALGSLVVVSLVYSFLGSHYQDGFGRAIGPPYLDMPVTILSLALGLGIFLVDRVWSKSRMARRPI